MRLSSFALPLLLLLCSQAGQAQEKSTIPKTLAEWQAWVMAGQEARKCALLPQRNGNALSDFSCVAASTMALRRKGAQTEFRVHIKADQDTWQKLPGDTRHWPRAIKIDGRDAQLQSTPAGWNVLLPRGEHTLSGLWDTTPDRIPSPALFANARWEDAQQNLRYEEGTLWLKTNSTVDAVVNTAPAAPQLQVWRALQDGQAMTLETQIDVQLSGSTERRLLGRALPPGFKIIGWEGTAPTVVDASGQLWLLAGAGRHTVHLRARCDEACLPNQKGALPSWTAPKNPAPWPNQETWSFLTAPQFRILRLDGNGVDPSSARVPSAWSQAPAYKVSATQGLQAHEIARGRQAGEGERLDLIRESWWRGDHWVHWDHLTGTLPIGGRISMGAPYLLGRVEQQNQLIPLSIDAQRHVGVELAPGNIDVFAQSATPMKRQGRTGWRMNIEHMEQTVHLPVGASMLAAPGARPAQGVWASSFTLLNLFAIALFAFLVKYRFGWRTGLLAGVLAAGWIGHSALFLFWAMAIASGFLLIAQFLPSGRLLTAIRGFAWATIVLLVMMFVPFAGEQMRLVLHPQLTPSQSYHESLASVKMQVMGGATAEMAAPAAAPAPMLLTNNAKRQATVLATTDLSNAMDNTDPLAGTGLAQVGEALPTWQNVALGHTYRLEYPGPFNSQATPERTPIVLAPGTVCALRLIGLLGILWLVVKFLLDMLPSTLQEKLPVPSGQFAKRMGLALLALLGLLTLLCLPATAAEPTPQSVQSGPSTPTLSSDLLDELRKRLTQPPACAPFCASLVKTQVEAREDSLILSYRVDSQTSTGWALPEVQGADILDVRVNGRPGWWLAPNTLRVEPGQTQILVRYQATSQQLHVQPGSTPLEQTLQLQGWAQEGSSDGSLTLVRQTLSQTTNTTTRQLPEEASVAGFVQVTRTFAIDSTTLVATTIHRIAGKGAITVTIPRIPGEQSLDETLEQTTAGWQATLPANQTTRQWTSQIKLPGDGKLTLTPLAASQGVETWEFAKQSGWSLMFEGIPETVSQTAGVRTILPLAGEVLHLQAARLPLAQGEQQRIDSVDLTSRAGDGRATHNLVIELFSAQASDYTLRLPPKSEVISITANDETLSLPLRDNALTVPVQRGSTRIAVEFRGRIHNALFQSPGVDLMAPANNIRYRMTSEDDRWILATFGTGAGTAVLYWSYLVVMLFVAYGLSRIPGNLFSLRTAVLLVLGFSTLPGTIFWLACLVGWIIWVAWRERSGAQRLSYQQFNLQQVVLAAFTMITLLNVTVVIGQGLLGAHPDMMLQSPPGLATLEWWRDRAPSGTLEGPLVVSAPLWLYQALLLAWALWFASWLLNAVRKALTAWTQGGYWRTAPKIVEGEPPRE